LIIDEKIIEYATPRQAELLTAVNTFGGIRPAARALQLTNKSLIDQAIRQARRRAAAHGWSPDHGLAHEIPEPFVARGHSTLDKIDPKTGERTQILQWTKTRLDEQKWLEAVRESVAAFCESVPAIPAAPPQGERDKDVIPWIQIGDAHIGMLAHEAETGANFDLKIAERELCAAIATLIDESGEHERFVINDLGDATHYENFAGTTEASGHALDYDTRYPKMIQTYSRIMRFIVDKVLEKANFVDVIINQGNHSRTNDIWMAELLRVAYGHTGRVNVLNNGSVFIGYRMGRTLVMTHHSDKCKPQRLFDVIASDFAVDWGETEYRYIDIGHIHHGMRMKELAGATLESWNTLAAKDKWAHDNGYRARQSITIVDRSRQYGEIGRRVLPIRRVQDMIKASGEIAHYAPAEIRAYAV
jgi:hypothetical protein